MIVGELMLRGNAPFTPIRDAVLVRWTESVSESPTFIFRGGLGPAELALVDRAWLVLYGCFGEFRLALRDMFPLPLEIACGD